ncbi:MAG: YncE family protein [Phycisphaerae bacterium]
MASVQLFGVPAKPVHGLARGALVLAAFLTGFVAHTECIHATTGQLLADFSFHSRDLLADPLQPYVYAMRADSNAISVIDTRTLSITSTIPLSGTGYGMALSPDGNSLYATEYSSNAVAVIDTHTLTVARTISLNYGPWAIAAGLNNRLYVLG